jgi:DNA-binding CsgD family transcriptional regulator
MAARLDHHAANARAMAGDLAQIYRQARARGQDRGGEGVRVITSMSELHNATGAVRCGAQRELRAIYDGSPRTAHMFALSSGSAGDRPVAADGRPVRVRATYDASVLRLPQAGKVLADRAEGGEESRFVSRLPFSVIVADDTIAVVDFTSYDSSGMGSLLARDHRVVLGLAALVDSYWAVATPTTEQGRDGLDQRQVFILTMLAAGATDAIIAEQSGLSQRTVERAVRALMARLGASTRFQAGIQAARRGWL